MFWTAIAVIVVGGYYFDLQKQKLKQEKRGGANSKEVKRQIGQLMAENEAMKERLRNLEYIIAEKKDYIDLDYEKEQMRLDNNTNKFEY
ncbi:hypothetical protein [Aureispira anguillae]|uniref:Uncharacterized protein n=1 Tax=Aureispira anguillae TaxID=2864201 RepID=A0A916DWY7_9BACT|nr:hypothetical protein [Aureispira anguillae]BDS15205.1 hypothetical protein AsAng_0059890 [Aureispira anguillae]